MKRWLKKHGRWLIVAFGICFIGWSSYALVTDASLESADEVIKVVLIVLYLMIVLWASGIAKKIQDWWERD